MDLNRCLFIYFSEDSSHNMTFDPSQTQDSFTLNTQDVAVNPLNLNPSQPSDLESGTALQPIDLPGIDTTIARLTAPSNPTNSQSLTPIGTLANAQAVSDLFTSARFDDIKTGDRTFEFFITYSDFTDPESADKLVVNRNSLGNDDIIVTGPKQFSQAATLLDITENRDANTNRLYDITATYQINAPRGLWDAADNGNYQILLQTGAVQDQQGRVVSSGEVGVARVNATPFSVNRVSQVDRDILSLEIKAGSIIRGQQTPYVAQPNDQVFEDNAVFRDGQVIGSLVGKDKNILYTLDQYKGGYLSGEWATRRRNFKIFSDTDQNFRQGITPTSIGYKAKPTTMGFTSLNVFENKFPLTHTLLLDTPFNFKEGHQYRVEFANNQSVLKNKSFRVNNRAKRSDAVHVSQLGFHPNDLAKVGFLSTWKGTGGSHDYNVGRKFELINLKTKESVYTGKITLSKDKNDTEDFLFQNYNGTNVYMMDFSDFSQAGRYKVFVDGVGTSYAFTIGDKTWEDAFKVATKGFYYQRSGIALEKPYSNFERPRPLHPDEGVVFTQSNLTIQQSREGIGNVDPFGALKAQSTGQVVNNAWGGYHDAGDWDRRIQHLGATRQLLELAEANPTYFETVDLNLPESNNQVPDLIDEALWSLDFFKRLQTPEGGIRGGIESNDGPNNGEGSWQDTNEWFVYKEDEWSSYIYAGVAARAASIVAPYNQAKANSYRNSAIQAMNWAEQRYANSQNPQQQVTDERHLAAVELFDLTGQDRWHQIFLEETKFDNSAAEIWVFNDYDQIDAAYVYAQSEQTAANDTIQANAKNAILRWADNQIDLVQRSAFKQSKFNGFEPIQFGGSFGSLKTDQLIKAHILSNQPKYLEAITLATQFGAGANPDNLVYTTGLGQKSPQQPLIIDQRILGKEHPGITTYGPYNPFTPNPPFFSPTFGPDVITNVTTPEPYEFPTTEAYFDFFFIPAVSEYTIHETMGPTSYTWGYLAAQNSQQ